MKYISVRELRSQPGRLWSSLAKGDVILTSNGKPRGLLVKVDDAGLDDTLDAIRRARAILAVSRMRGKAATAGVRKLSLDRIHREIGEVRRRRPA